jgi:aspartyl-tRNA(Asn)/glutamyl-tRNA(Gln) amidotransferase subunit B
MEIVTAPGSFSPAQARDFFSSLRQVLMYLGVNDGNLQEGSLRVDVNVSVHDSGGPLGTKVEVKNLNSFRALERSLEFEIERQSRLLHQGRAVEQETRGWVEKEEVTIGQRTKEYAHDYRYFPEPDLPPIVVSQERLIALRSHLPELPVPRLQRLTTQYNLPLEVARVLTQERALADYFESLVAAAPDLPARTLANWTINELLRALAESQTPFTAIPIPPASLGDLVRMVEQGQLSSSAGKRVLEEMYRTGEAAGAVVSRLDLTQLGDAAALESLVDAVLAEQPQLVDTYRSGKTNVLQAIIGQVMKASKGRANPAIVREILERRLGSRT